MTGMIEKGFATLCNPIKYQIHNSSIIVGHSRIMSYYWTLLNYRVPYQMVRSGRFPLMKQLSIGRWWDFHGKLPLIFWMNAIFCCPRAAPEDRALGQQSGGDCGYSQARMPRLWETPWVSHENPWFLLFNPSEIEVFIGTYMGKIFNKWWMFNRHLWLPSGTNSDY